MRTSMHGTMLGPMLSCTAVAAALAATACSGHLLDRWDEPTVLVQEIRSPPDEVWARVRERVGELDLLVTHFHEDAIQFGWVTPPGDGRAYLRCRQGQRVGSASLLPRIMVRPTTSGSQIEVSSRVRATAASRCTSTGRFEAGLLQRLEPAIAAGAREDGVRTSPQE